MNFVHQQKEPFSTLSNSGVYSLSVLFCFVCANRLSVMKWRFPSTHTSLLFYVLYFYVENKASEYDNNKYIYNMYESNIQRMYCKGNSGVLPSM